MASTACQPECLSAVMRVLHANELFPSADHGVLLSHKAKLPSAPIIDFANKNMNTANLVHKKNCGLSLAARQYVCRCGIAGRFP